MEERQKSEEMQKEQRRSRFSNDPFKYVKILFTEEKCHMPFWKNF